MWALYLLISMDLGTFDLSRGPCSLLLDRTGGQGSVVPESWKRPQHRSPTTSPTRNSGPVLCSHITLTSFRTWIRPSRQLLHDRTTITVLAAVKHAELLTSWCQVPFNGPWKFKDTIPLAIRKASTLENLGLFRIFLIIIGERWGTGTLENILFRLCFTCSRR